MRRICGWHFGVLGMATLADYELIPDGRGFATVRPQNHSRVIGALYEIDEFCLDALDKFEGHPEVFARVEVTVKDLSSKILQAWMYMETIQEPGKFLQDGYIRRMLIGAQENHLPKEWIEYIRSFGHH
jgi:gamma-glutamylcyclotransferase (GGCT)/AIG2-like uncharacterized protein YtfP